ncbi:MAG: hypothetical protein JNM80_01660 [Phycisphaerae bacterium]|nr:hypothetical protein [Phycisphaerae bacterium]
MPPSNATPKVFVVGLSKTGTHSLHNALLRLGLRSIHYPDPAPFLRGEFSSLAPFDAAGDIPVSLFFKELDAAYPASRFILTTRPLDPWLESIRAHLARRDHPRYTTSTPAAEVRRRIYGSPRFDPDGYARAYHLHLLRVHDHFRDRPRDLLELNICGGEGWDSLCPFLGLPVPAEPFPHTNRRPDIEPEPVVVSVPAPAARPA